jgi:hypothetical protein
MIVFVTNASQDLTATIRGIPIWNDTGAPNAIYGNDRTHLCRCKGKRKLPSGIK